MKGRVIETESYGEKGVTKKTAADLRGCPQGGGAYVKVGEKRMKKQGETCKKGREVEPTCSFFSGCLPGSRRAWKKPRKSRGAYLSGEGSLEGDVRRPNDLRRKSKKREEKNGGCSDYYTEGRP